MNRPHHLIDYISAEDGRVFYVSTVVECPSPGPAEWYETMIFECGQIIPETNTPEVLSWSELYTARYDSWVKAIEGHKNACNIASAGDL